MSTVRSIEAFAVSMPRDVPYLGPLGPGESVNAKGYIVRRGNRTIYPSSDMSVIVRAETADGTSAGARPTASSRRGAVLAILRDVLIPFVEGRDPRDARQIYDDLYDMQRVRGASGGYYGDALAAIDIALWDLAAKDAGVPLSKLLGGQKRRPDSRVCVGAAEGDARRARRRWRRRGRRKGFRGVKYAAAVSHEGVVDEMRALREALGRDVDLMVDLHWKYTAREALELAADLAPFDPYFIEAPVRVRRTSTDWPQVAAQAPMPVAAGEEWRNVYEARMRLPRAPLAFVQPEMGHTGVSQFLAIARLADQHRAGVDPARDDRCRHLHGGVSLHASATLPNCPYHEYQHSVFDRNLEHVDTTMRCAAGFYTLPGGPGLGVEPRRSLERFRLPL